MVDCTVFSSDLMDAMPGTALGSAEDVLSHGLPWPVVSLSRLSARSVVDLIRSVRVLYGQSTFVTNRVFYSIDDVPDEDDIPMAIGAPSAAGQRTVAYTYDAVGFIAVVQV